MIPVGYMAKKISARPEWLKTQSVDDIYSVSGCVSENFLDYIQFWKHNGYWFFDKPEGIYDLSQDCGIDITNCKMFYYEAHPQEYDEKTQVWYDFMPESFFTDVSIPSKKFLEGYDIVNFYARSCPECSPLSCNHMAEEITVNKHCLLSSFDEAKHLLESGKFEECEPGPYRIFAVYTLPES